jgi:N-formylglutamate deformylase
MKNLVLHIPHSSTIIPNNIRNQFCLSNEELNLEMLRMTDHYTNELFDIKQADKIIFPVSRLVLDPERFADDKLESMSKIGHGVVYTNTSQLTPLRNNLTDEEKKDLLNEFYYPHHKNLENACQQSLDLNNNCLLIDCHSFPSKALHYELKTNNNKSRPQICLGSDNFHTDKKLIETAFKLFKQKGYEVEINTPFAGTLIPTKFYNKNNKVQGIMFEIRRDLYMNEQTGQKNSNFKKIQKDIADVIKIITKNDIIKKQLLNKILKECN